MGSMACLLSHGLKIPFSLRAKLAIMSAEEVISPIDEQVVKRALEVQRLGAYIGVFELVCWSLIEMSKSASSLAAL